MGSTFVHLDKDKSIGNKLFGDSYPDIIWLQFVPGIVGKVINNMEDNSYNDIRRNINSILAKAHVGENLKKTSFLDDEDRYYPLFRGITDVPMIGDQVLLCTVGGIQYYLGPINTSNVPGYNPDPLETNDIIGTFKNKDRIYHSDITGISKNWTDNFANRLEKQYNINLDDPEKTKQRFNSKRNGKEILSDIHGDLIFEGRHGNSIRIGSRYVNPYIYISNNNTFGRESLMNGSTIALLDRGSIHDYFIDDDIDFVLASDNPDYNTSNRLIGTNIYNYNYGNYEDYTSTDNQLLQTSDRITINARRDSIFLSAAKNVVIGTGNDFSLKTKGRAWVDAGNVIIGSTESVNEPMVLGLKLVEVLGDIIKAIGQLQVGATVGGISAPVQGSGSPGWLELENITSNKITQILSNFHFIEDNETKK